MKIRVKFDNTQLKLGCNGKITGSKNKNNPNEPAFFEVDLDFLYMLFKMFPPNISGPAIGKLPKKSAGSVNPNSQIYLDAAGITLQMPANGHDIFNYVARYGAANYQIQAVLKLDGKLDPEKLTRAVRLSIDTEPVLGCRLVENEPPYWKRLSDIDKVQFCSFETTNRMDEAVQRFLESPFSMDHDPMVKLRLISSGTYDTLCMKINHTCCDGTGAKEYLQLLSDIYTRIDQDNGVYVPKPSVRTRKDQDRLFSALGITDPETAWSPPIDIPKMMWAFPWQQGKPDIARVAVSRLPAGYVDIMSKYAKARGASINDMLLAAFYRAMFETTQPEYGIPMHISMTVDLRRYLPDQKAEAIRNFSGGVDSSIPRVEGETFEGTLSRIVSVTDQIKNSRPGLQSAIGLERVEKANFFDTLAYYGNSEASLTYTDEFAPVLSNLSFLSKSLYKFGKNTVTDAYIIPPAISAPGLLLCVGTYNNMVTFSVNYYESQARREDMEMFLNSIMEEIIEGCKG